MFFSMVLVLVVLISLYIIWNVRDKTTLATLSTAVGVLLIYTLWLLTKSRANEHFTEPLEVLK